MASSYNLRYKTSPDGRHYSEQEVHHERPKIITRQLEMGQEMSQNSIYQFLTTIVKVEDIRQVIKKKHVTEYFEITFWEQTVRNEIEAFLSTPGLQFDGKPLRVVQTTPLTLIEQKTIVKVNIFETPCEHNDSYIINHFSQYGDLQSNTVYHQTFKNSPVYNGVRSFNYLNLKKPLPTVVWVQGNRVKTRHPNQDRTAFCSVCRTKGHYRSESPKSYASVNAGTKSKEQTNENTVITENMNTVTTENIVNNPQNVTEDNSVQEAWKRHIDKVTRTKNNSKPSFAQAIENDLHVVPETESEMNSHFNSEIRRY